ncbi:MAG: hypothetical protein LBI80_03010 [Endomicrobium sp.]|jgi:hypothetical protein|nr:hypothetical protein [Endomicrobium sp.]
MKKIIKNHYHLNCIVAIIIAIFFVLNIFAISISEKPLNISLKSSDRVVLNLGEGLLKFYQSINVPIVKITNSIFGLSIYKDVLVDNKLVKFYYHFCFKDDSQKKACSSVSLAGVVLSLNALFKVSNITISSYSNIKDDLSFCSLKNKGFIKLILLFMILMLILPRGIPLGKLSKRVNKMRFEKPTLYL